MERDLHRGGIRHAVVRVRRRRLPARHARRKRIVGEGIELCFAIKANPFLIPAAIEVAGKLEVCSPGELDICEALGVDPAAIVFSGVNKTPDSVHDAVEYGVGVLTAESLKHAALIEAEGAARGEVLDVLARLNAGSQFGMSRDDLLSIVDRRADYPHLNIVGIHYFVGTQRLNLKHQRKELEKLAELIDEARRRAWLRRRAPGIRPRPRRAAVRGRRLRRHARAVAGARARPARHRRARAADH